MMLCTVTLPASFPIASVSFTDADAVMDSGPAAQVVTAEQTQLLAELESQKTEMAQTLSGLQKAAAQLTQTCQSLVTDHQDQIAQLAVEIARTVLMQQIEEGAYDIATIVKEALSHSPTLEDVSVRVNPQDLAVCRAAQAEKQGSDTLKHIQFVADPQIGRAECVVESPKGIIQSMIDEHLHQISEALKKTR